MPHTCHIVPGLFLTVRSSITWFTDTRINSSFTALPKQQAAVPQRKLDSSPMIGFPRTLGLESYVIPFSKQNTGGQDSPPFNATASGHRTFSERPRGR